MSKSLAVSRPAVKTVAVLAMLLLVAVAGGWATHLLFKAQRTISGINVLPAPSGVAGAPAAAADGLQTTTFLVYSHGGVGLTAEDAERLSVPDWRNRGSDRLTDSMMLAVVDPNTPRVELVSLPRDLWVDEYGHKLNELLPIYGVETLVEQVESITQVPVDHLVQVDFLGFEAMVEALGGVEMWLPNRVRDAKSHLDPIGPGRVLLDGPTALAYARSRTPQVYDEATGTWSLDVDAASDFGRIDNQQQVLLAAWSKLRGPQLLMQADKLLNVAADHLQFDQNVSLTKLARVGQAISNVGTHEIGTQVWPGDPDREGRLWVVREREDEASVLRAQLRQWVGRPPTATIKPA